METVTLGIIGGSGLYDIDGIKNLDEIKLETPFGEPSDAFITGELEGIRCVFLPRHGRGHRFTPTEVNYRANIWGLKKLGCQNVLSVSAVGSLKEEIEPGHLICVDQFIDRTRGRVESFFGQGIVGHVQFGDPVEENLRQILLSAVSDVGVVGHDGGTYVCIEGPTFSTRAESELYRSWGAHLVGMTNVPEARLAREAELGYATLALCTDYDCWHSGHDEVSVETVIEIIRKNVNNAKSVIRALCRRLDAVGPVEWPAHRALANGMAIMTTPEKMPQETRKQLELFIGRYF
ncbi:MAG: S-methyl-5'-thioadenosine phosphorylase [Myxococcota bacterium]|nr:S-methyl-5'-thioadenosine phosphorylase [Myxococcota bacterium]